MTCRQIDFGCTPNLIMYSLMIVRTENSVVHKQILTKYDNWPDSIFFEPGEIIDIISFHFFAR